MIIIYFNIILLCNQICNHSSARTAIFAKGRPTSTILLNGNFYLRLDVAIIKNTVILTIVAKCPSMVFDQVVRLLNREFL